MSGSKAEQPTEPFKAYIDTRHEPIAEDVLPEGHDPNSHPLPGQSDTESDVLARQNQAAADAGETILAQYDKRPSL